MCGAHMNMKLKIRAAIFACGGLSFFAIFVAINELPTLHDGRLGLFRKKFVKRAFQEPEEQAHIFTLRKRLNKSNYTSENISPEMGKRAVEVKGSAKDTVEDGRYRSDNVHLENPSYEDPDKQSIEADHSHSSEHFNTTDPLIDKMIDTLQFTNGLKFNFDRTKYLPYPNFVKITKKADSTERTKFAGLSELRWRVYNMSGRVGSMKAVPIPQHPSMSNWERFHKGIHQFGLYSGEDGAIDAIIDDMAQQQIVDVEMKEGGTQLKLIITFSDEGQALFKPMRYPREQETLPDHFYFVDFERHNAEIAAFHLDRVLAFYRVPPTVGRQVNLTEDIKRLAESKIKKTFFISPANNVCFHGTCSYYCDTGHAICGHPDMLEGSFATFLPPERIAPRKTWRNPWKRSYSKHRKAYWEVYDDLCERVQDKEPFKSGRMLLDIIDMHIFDFLTGNMDRHHFETFVDFGNETFLLHLDNGRGFGRSGHDEMSVLAPVFQCCTIRYTTFTKLIKFYQGPHSLGMLMRQSMKKDPANPILTEPHIRALDRRVIKILKVLENCLRTRPYTDVIIDDFY